MAAATGNVLRNLQLNPDQQTRCREVYRDLHWFWVVSIIGTPALDRDLCIRNIQLTGRALHYVLNGGAKPDSTEITIVGDDLQADWATSTVPKLQRWVASSGLKFLKVDDAAKTLTLQTHRLQIPCRVTVSFSKAENESLYASVPVLWDKESMLLHEPPPKAPSLKAFIKGLQAGKQPDEAMLDQFWQKLKGSPKNSNEVFVMFDAYEKLAKLKEKTAVELMIWFFTMEEVNRANRFFKTYGTAAFFQYLPTEKLSEAQAKQLLHWYKKDATVANLPIIVRCFKICKDVEALAEIYKEIYEKNNNIKKETEDFLSDLDPELAAQVKQHPLNSHIFAALFPPRVKKAKKPTSGPVAAEKPVVSCKDPINAYKEAIQFLDHSLDDRLDLSTDENILQIRVRMGESTDLILKKMNKSGIDLPAIERFEKLLVKLREKMLVEGLPADQMLRLREYYSGAFNGLFRLRVRVYDLSKDPIRKRNSMLAFIAEFPAHVPFLTLGDLKGSVSDFTVFVLKNGDHIFLDLFRETIKGLPNSEYIDTKIMREACKWFRVKPSRDFYQYLKSQKLPQHFSTRFQIMTMVLQFNLQKVIFKKLSYTLADVIELYDEFMATEGAQKWIDEHLKDKQDKDWIVALANSVKRGKQEIQAGQVEEKKEENITDYDWAIMALDAYIRLEREDEYYTQLEKTAQLAINADSLNAIIRLAKFVLHENNPYRDPLWAHTFLLPVNEFEAVKPIINQATVEALKAKNKKKKGKK